MYMVAVRYVRTCSIKMIAVRINIDVRHIIDKIWGSKEVTIVCMIAEDQSYERVETPRGDVARTPVIIMVVCATLHTARRRVLGLQILTSTLHQQLGSHAWRQMASSLDHCSIYCQEYNTYYQFCRWYRSSLLLDCVFSGKWGMPHLNQYIAVCH